MCVSWRTEFTEGIQDMAEYWKHPCGDFVGTREDLHDFDVAQYFEQWDQVDYSKAILYGQVAIAIIRCLCEDFAFSLPFDDDLIDECDIITLLYTVRRPIIASDGARDVRLYYFSESASLQQLSRMRPLIQTRNHCCCC